MKNKVLFVKKRNEEEKPRRINWAIWLPTIVAIIGCAIWFFLFAILNLGGWNPSLKQLTQGKPRNPRHKLELGDY